MSLFIINIYFKIEANNIPIRTKYKILKQIIETEPYLESFQLRIENK